MTAFLLGVFATVAGAVLLGLARTEATTRLERLPLLMLRLAVRRLPQEHRADQLEEWAANVHDVIHPQTEDLPLTRLTRGLWFAASAWWGAPRLARELCPTRGPHRLSRYVTASYKAGARVERWCGRRGLPRPLGEFAGWTVARHPFALMQSWGTAQYVLLNEWSVVEGLQALGLALPVVAAGLAVMRHLEVAVGRAQVGALRPRWLLSETLNYLGAFWPMTLGFVLVLGEPGVFIPYLLAAPLTLGLVHWRSRRTPPPSLTFCAPLSAWLPRP